MWEILAFALLIGGAAGSALFYFRRSRRAGATRPLMIGAVGGLLFVALFFGVNGFIDDRGRMPQWFLDFIYEFGDAAGFCLIGAFVFAATLGLGFLFIRPKAA